MKVLLIEDNPDYAFLIETMLRSSDPETISFTWADGLEKGIQQLQQDPVNVILLDLSLPDSDGLATLTALKTKAGRTPIIVLTGCNDEQLAIEAMRLGAQDHLLKTDIDKRALLRALRYAIERRSSEDKYRELVESIDAIVWEADPVTWRFTFVSKAAETILGYPIERWLEASDFWVNLIHPDDRSATVDYCTRQIEQGDNHEFEYRVVALDGRIVWLRDIVRVIKNESGQPITLRGVMIDITQSKDAAAELQKHHYEIESLQEISQIILEAAEPNTGIAKALEKSIAVGGFDFGDILLTTPEGEFVSVTAACGFRDPANLHRTPRPKTSTHRRAHLQQSSVKENIQAGDRFRSLKQEGAETAVIVPLRSGNVSFGLLQLASRRAKEIQPNELALAEAMGRQIGIAIQKAKLTEELQTNLQRIQTLYECNIAVTSTLDLRAVLEILLEKMDIFPKPGAAITFRLMDSQTGRLEYFAIRNLDKMEWIGEYGTNRKLSGGGLTKHTIASSHPLVIQDLRTDPRVLHPDFLRRQGLCSYLGVQVRIKELTVGIVGIYTRMPYEFSRDEISSITSLASHAAIAIHHARLYTEIENNAQELAALLAVASAASQSLELKPLLHGVIKTITENFHFDATRFFVFDEAREALQLCASYTGHPDFSSWSGDSQKGRGISGTVAATGEAIIVSDALTDPIYEKLSWSKSTKNSGQRFIADFPVKYKDEVLGVLMCMSQNSRQFTDHERRLIASMLSQIAISIHNARLYAEVEKQSRELAALFDVTAAATQSLEMGRVLEEVIRRINEIFLFDATRFFLFDDQAEWLHCRATHQVNSSFLTRASSFKKGQGITGRVGATGVAIIIDDTQTNPQYQQLSHTKATEKAGERFVAGFPVKYGSETLGVIMCMGEQPRQLTNHETDLITSLSSQVAIAIANARLYEQTKVQAEQLRNLATHLEAVREQERSLISREIHDELGQTLTALKFDAAWIKGKLSNHQPALADRLAEMSTMIDNTIQAVRKIAARLRPDILDKLGLAAAIEWQLQEFRKRTGIRYHFAADPIDIHLDEQQATTLFRIFQESLTNVARHSHATRVNIDLEQQDAEVFLRVDDDGDGIEADKISDKQSLGLLGMRERAASLGGDITIQRNHIKGTSVITHLPLSQVNETTEFSPRSERL